MNGRRFKTWQQMESAMQRAADEHAEATFVHPADLIDEGEGLAIAGAPADPVLGEIFRRMLAVCLPPRSYGDERRWQAGYHRLVAFCYRLTPEMFDNAPRAELAAKLGISVRAFGKQLEYVDAILAGRVPPAPSANEREV